MPPPAWLPTLPNRPSSPRGGTGLSEHPPAHLWTPLPRSPAIQDRTSPPQPILRVPQDLVYAQVVKTRRGGRVVQGEIRPIFGKDKLPKVVQALGWKKANTSAIERFTLPYRLRNERKARKTLAFSKRTGFHDAMSWISAVHYNFLQPQRSLRRRTPEGGGSIEPQLWPRD